MKRILITGGAPRIRIDAVRHLVVHATGTTALQLRELLHGLPVDLLLGTDAQPQADALRFADRQELESQLHRWIAANPDGAVVMAAAVNDYRLHAVERIIDGVATTLAADAKAASGADELVIRLRPDGKLIDRLRPEFGLRGMLVGFKYEDRSTVIASAAALARRAPCDVVLANSLCGTVQALVRGSGEPRMFAARSGVLDALATELRDFLKV